MEPKTNCHLLPVICLVSPVIWVARQDCKCPVDLLGYHQPGKRMGQGHGPKRKRKVCPLENRIGPSVGRADGKDDVL